MTREPRSPLDDPTKVQPEDVLNKLSRIGVRALVAALPGGGLIADLFDAVVGDPARERRDDFMTALFERLKLLEEQGGRFSIEELRDNVPFQATVIQAVQTAARTAQEEKIEMLRNAALNTAIRRYDENVRQLYLGYIDRFTALHVSVLMLYDDSTAIPAVKDGLETLIAVGIEEALFDAAIPELRGKAGFTRMLVEDLEAANLIRRGGFGAMKAGDLAERRTTDFGRGFLEFISDPTL